MSVIKIHQKVTFTVQEANELIPTIYNITHATSKLVSEYLKIGNEEGISKAVEKWQKKMDALGVKGNGLWMVDFDTGAGYLCWKYPELKVCFQHGYTEGFQARSLIV